MFLTRNQWIEMWGTVKLIEHNTRELKVLLSYLPPYRRNQLRGTILANESELEFMKNQIQSIIGQME